MSPTLIGLIVFLFTFVGALFGAWVRASLPRHHVEADSKDTIKVAIGLIATMTALVLGLVTASSKSSFDAVDDAVKQTATEVLVLDRTLARYGPETKEIRNHLHQAVSARVDAIWPEGAVRPISLDPMRSGAATTSEGLADVIRQLQAKGRCPAGAASPRGGSLRSLAAGAMAGAFVRGNQGARTISHHHDLLADGHLHEFRAVRSKKRYRRRCAVPLFFVGCVRTVPGTRDGNALRGRAQGLGRAAAAGSCAHEPISSRRIGHDGEPMLALARPVSCSPR